MKNWQSIVVMAALIALAVPALAQEAAIGVYFDLDATQNTATNVGGFDVEHTAYVMVTNAEQMVAGGAFKIVMDPRIIMLSAVYPPGINYGDPLGTGVEVAITDPVVAYYGVPALLATLTLSTLDNLMDNAEIQIVSHGEYAAPTISNHLGTLTEVAGDSAFLTIPVENEAQTWGSMKALYAD